MPMTFGIAIAVLSEARKNAPGQRAPGAKIGGVARPPLAGGRDAPSSLQVLTRVDDLLHAALLLFGLAHERLDVHDALALLAGDLSPVVGVGGIGQVFVLLELLADRGQQVVDHDALLAAADVALERELLGPADDRL